ncbi:hypothetical protein [uncultured Stenotrophomonas sp.]|uniref:hypothetical protein n=1 Tax=uncultured Stenotrophomonas sp. TaxID=165438 RepID=UPI0028EDBEB4|nr:hypothetical protein [uncultured Stenotrophomonas sp.]
MNAVRYPTSQERSIRAGRTRAALYAHVVEGKLVTTSQIAKRVDVSIKTAYDRAKRGPFPLTWAALRSRRKPSA